MRRLLTVLFLAAAASASADAPKNIVFIDVCSLRADRLGTYGYSRDTSPEIDALAKKSAVFENAMGVGSWCLPNYATLFSGRYPEQHGLYSNAVRGIPEFQTTLAEKLKEGGYETAAFSGGVYMLPEWGLNRGFDHFVNSFSTAPESRRPAPLAANLGEVGDWLAGRGGEGKPFFLYVAVDNLHAPVSLKGPNRYDPGYEGVAKDTHTMGVPFARAYSGEPDGYSQKVKSLVEEFKSDPKHLAHYNARYDSAVRETDGEIGEFLARLKALKLDKDTIVVVTGDHGETLGERGALGHTQGLYESNLRVPLIVRHPGEPKSHGKRYPQLVERVDMMPTILDWAGVDRSRLSLPGASLGALLKNPAAPWRRYAFASSRRNLPTTERDLRLDERVARDERWKLHSYLYKDGFELYDLKTDPNETKNLAAERPEIVNRLSFELLRWLENNRPLTPSRPRFAPAALERSAPRD